MKKFHITNILEAHNNKSYATRSEELIAIGNEDMQVSDGFHTMDELYDHRITLFIALCRAMRNLGSINDASKVWKSKLHSDGSSFEGWFIVGIGDKAGEQISYHLPLDRWDETEFIPEIEKAPEFDGHSPADILERLKKL